MRRHHHTQGPPIRVQQCLHTHWQGCIATAAVADRQIGDHRAGQICNPIPQHLVQREGVGLGLAGGGVLVVVITAAEATEADSCELLQQQQAFMTSWLDISSTGDDDNEEEEEKKATEEPLE